MSQNRTLVEIFLDRARKTPDLPALRIKRDGSWQVVTFKRFEELSREVAAGLLELGVKKGDAVGIFSANRPEWNVVDVGIMLAGAVTVPVYSTSSIDQVVHILGHSKSVATFVDGQEAMDKLLKIQDQLTGLKAVVAFDEVQGPEDWVISLDDLKAKGAAYNAANPNELASRISNVVPEDLATIVYTSGTTGNPKGAMLTHGGFSFALDASGRVLELKDGGERVLSYLPLSHIFERLNSGWGGIAFGMDVWFAESIATLVADLQECRPTFFIGVPRVFEKFYHGLKEKIEVNPKRHLIEKAIDSSLAAAALEQAGKPTPILMKLKNRVFDKLVLSKLRERLGMQDLRVAVTGGAPIEPRVINFIRAIGLELVEGYGQTESNAPTAITPPRKVRLGSVGPPIPGLEVKFDSDGEILIKAPSVFKGYFEDPDATKEALTSDGFLRTGDVGELDEAGYLRITDRKKDLIKTAGGKYIAPQVIEGKLKFSPLIAQALVVGDKRPYPAALLTLEPEFAQKWAKEHGIEVSDPVELTKHSDVLAEVEKVVESVNSGLSHAEQIKRWTVLPQDFSQEAEELTPKLSVKRKVVCAKYAAEIETLYGAEG